MLINAASAAMPLFRTQSAAVLPSLAPHGSKARLRVVTNCRGSWRSHVHRTYIAQRVQFFKIKTANVRGRGGRPLVLSLGGLKGGYSLSEKENIPLYRTSARCGSSPAAQRAALQSFSIHEKITFEHAVVQLTFLIGKAPVAALKVRM